MSYDISFYKDENLLLTNISLFQGEKKTASFCWLHCYYYIF